jgi:hypothetical protein
VDYPNSADDIRIVEPLKFLKTEKLERSNYFSQGFYPLNSLFQMIVLTQEPLKVKEVNSKIIPTVLVDGEKFPEDITQKGWSFISESGDRIEAMYLFGKDFVATNDELVLTLTSADNTEPIKENIAESSVQEIDLSQVYIIVGIVAAAAIAIAFYLKGFRAKH